MAIVTIARFIDSLAEHGLLDAERMSQVRPMRSRFRESRELAAHLLQTGYLTAFQVNLILTGRADKLVLGPYRLLERLGSGGMGVDEARRQAVLARDPR